MSGLGLGDMGEVELTAALFVQRRYAGPPGGSGPGSLDKNITRTRFCRMPGQTTCLCLHRSRIAPVWDEP